MKRRQKWTKTPNEWIIAENGLKEFVASDLADNASALMCLAVIVHEAEQATGVARVTYDQFEIAMLKSRSVVSRGLTVLKERRLIEGTGQRSVYALTSYDPMAGWSKFPCAALYDGDKIAFFADCSLRNPAELDAMKLMFLFSAFRDNRTNVARISYDKIIERAGIPRERIKRAVGLLAANGLAYPEMMPSAASAYGVSHGYRLTGIEPYIHAGTHGRKLLLES
jgi:hypothetical protein